MDTEARIRAKYYSVRKALAQSLRATAESMIADATLIEGSDIDPSHGWRGGMRQLERLADDIDLLRQFWVEPPLSVGILEKMHAETSKS